MAISPSDQLKRAWEMLAGTICAPAAWPRTVLAKLTPTGTLQVAPREPPHDRALPLLDAAEVEALIRLLTCKRGMMAPAVPLQPASDCPLWIGENLQFVVEAAADGSDEWRLLIRHSGLGWVALPLSPNELRALQRCLQDAAGPLPAP